MIWLKKRYYYLKSKQFSDYELSKQTLSLITINCCRSACAVCLRSDHTHTRARPAV